MNTPTFEPSRCLPIRSMRMSNGPRGTEAGALRKSDSETFACTGTIPAPALFAYVYAFTSALAAGAALSAATTCAAGLDGAPAGFVARGATMSLAGTPAGRGGAPTPGVFESAGGGVSPGGATRL